MPSDVAPDIAAMIAQTKVAWERVSRERARELGCSVDEVDAREKEIQAQREAATAESALRAGRRRLLAASGVALEPDTEAALVADELRESAALIHAKRWMSAHENRPRVPRVLVLCGGTGVGKTLAGLWAMLRSANRPGAQAFIRAAQLAQRLDPWRGEAVDEKVDVRCGFILLDDLGMERDSAEPRWSEAFERLIDERQARGLTLITSNMRRSEFRDRYDVRVIDRLNHCARAVEISGDSLRRKDGGL